MKINRLLALSLGIMSIGATAAIPFQKGLTPPKKHNAAKSLYSSSQSFKAIPAPQTLLNEDFSKFSDGTPDAPGAEIAYEDGYYIPETLTEQPGWTGGGVYPAGGTVALMTRSIDDRLGFISTPPLPLGGTATLTFKARCLPGHTGGSLWIALCDDYYGPGEDQADFELTDEWETYTLVATHAELDEYSYFQIQAENNYVQIDDVNIDLVRDRLPSPYPNKAINISPTEFIASWDDCDTPLYRLNVICQRPDENPIQGVIAESFDGIKLNADGKTIDLTSPNYPTGWEINLSSHGQQDISTTEGTYLSAPQSLFFEAEEDAITSPETPEPINGFKFWVKPSQMDDDDYGMSLLRVEIYHSLTGTWENIAHLPAYWMEKDGDFYEFSPEALGEDATRVRIAMIQRGKVDFYIDDVEISYASRGVTEFIVKDLDIEQTSYTVTGINPDFDYSYYVQATDGDIFSEPSYVIWVDGITGLKPEVLQPTDVTSNSFTANWKKLGHATKYKVETECILRANQDMPGTVILEEDFNLIDSEVSFWMSPYNFAENGMASTGWCATQPAWQPGMAGTSGTSWYGGAGLVYSPVLNLSGNAGQGFEVEATVVTTTDKIQDEQGNSYEEGVFVMVLNSINDSQAVTAALIETPTIGSHTAKVTVANPDGADLSNVIVAFMNKSGTPFYVDDVKITQNLRKGEETTVPFSIEFTDETSLTIDGLREGVDYSYKVTASTNRNYEDFISETSDTMLVTTGTVGVETINTLSECSAISISKGHITATAKDNEEIKVYSTSGIVVAASKGSLNADLKPGIYMVKIGEASSKVSIR